MDPFSILNQYGWPIGGLLIVVWAFYFDLIVTGARHRKLEAEKDQWQRLALELGGMSRSALSIAERHVLPREPGAGL